MSRFDAELRYALESRSAPTVDGLDHPDPELISAYRFGKATPEDEDRLRAHLAWCRECTTLMLGLEDFLGAEGGATSIPRSEEDWDALQARLSPDRPARERRSWRLPWTVVRGIRWSPQLVAASLTVIILGLVGWIAHLHGTVESLSSPRINVAISDLYVGDFLRGSEEKTVNQIPADAKTATLILHSSHSRDFPDYMLTIEDSEGSEIWRRRGLRRSDWQTFTLDIPGDFLPPGTYRLRLFGADGTRWQAIEVFSLRVVDQQAQGS